jgi:type IV pilus assembly protein PilA
VDVLNMMDSYKNDIAVCSQMNNNSLSGCTAGASGPGWTIKAAITAPIGYAAALDVTGTGVIVATAISTSGLSGESYILTPTASTDGVVWEPSGSCKMAGIC